MIGCSGTETERELVALERVGRYCRAVESEPGAGAGRPTPYHWPSEGVLAVRGVSYRYRPHLPLALHQVSLHTRPAEKVGIVGRTGAGKSSLFHCLFRLAELEEGSLTSRKINSQLLKSFCLN